MHIMYRVVNCSKRTVQGLYDKWFHLNASFGFYDISVLTSSALWKESISMLKVWCGLYKKCESSWIGKANFV